MIKGIKLDKVGFEKQIEAKKLAILAGVNEGFKNGLNLLENIMKFYIDKTVYEVYSPKYYDRTFELRNRVTARIEGDSIFVYVDDSGMEQTKDGVTYPFRVLEGHKVHPYDFTPHDGSWGAYMNSRDWVEATRLEFINHMTQSQEFLNIVKQAVQKRI